MVGASVDPDLPVKDSDSEKVRPTNELPYPSTRGLAPSGTFGAQGGSDENYYSKDSREGMGRTKVLSGSSQFGLPILDMSERVSGPVNSE